MFTSNNRPSFHVGFDGNFLSFFLVQKYPFCINLVQKFKRVSLRRNLVPTFEGLIDVPPPSPLLINFSIFFHPGHSYANPPPPTTTELLGNVSNPDKLFETIHLC